MNEDRNQDRFPKQQTKQKHPEEWQRDLNPGHLAGQNIGAASDARVLEAGNALHLRKRGVPIEGLDDEELKRVPLVAEGERLQQGSTYVDLQASRREEFTARGDMEASAGHAYVAKDRVPYQIWNRLIGEPKPGQ
jgi:hypothetical protein